MTQSTSNDSSLKTESSLKIEKQICFSLYSASNALTRAYKPLLQQLDLTYLQYMTMIVLWSYAPVTVKEIGHKLHLDSGTLTPLLKRLNEKGLIDKKRSENDERKVFIHLTEQGKKLEAKAQAIPEQITCKVNMSAEQASELKTLADLLLNQLHKLDE